MRLDLLVVLHCFFKLLYVCLMLGVVRLLIVFVMKELQAACGLPACNKQMPNGCSTRVRLFPCMPVICFVRGI